MTPHPDRDISRREAVDLAEQAEDRMIVLGAKEYLMTLQYMREVREGPSPAEALGEFRHFMETVDAVLTAFDEGKTCRVIIEDRSGMVPDHEEGKPVDPEPEMQRTPARDGVPGVACAAASADRD